MARFRSEDAAKKETVRPPQEMRKETPAPVKETPASTDEDTELVDITEIDERISRLEEFTAQFVKFVEAAGPIVDDHAVRVVALEAASKEAITNITGLAAAITKFNVELSKLTGELYRYGAENNDYHLALAKVINDMSASLPVAVERIILEYAERAEAVEQEEAAAQPAPEEPAAK